MTPEATGLPISVLEDLSDRSGLQRFGQRVRIGVLATAVSLLLISYVLDRISAPGHAEAGRLIRLCAACLAAIPVLTTLLRNVGDGSSESFTDQLVTLAVLGAIVSGEYVTAVLVPVLMDLAHELEMKGMPGTRSALEGLRQLTARPATIIDEHGEREVLPHQVQVGQVLLLKHGATLVADGVVTQGCGAIDESSLTGESLPRDVSCGDQVFAGTVNVSGLLRVQVTVAGEQTSLGRIRRMLVTAMQSKSPLTQSVERCAELYVPLVLMIAVVVFFVTRDMQRVITVFIVSCPCALVLSGPATMIASLAAAARNGILIKNARFLESLADADTVVFDKTGTVTTGQLSVVKSVPANGSDATALITVAIDCARVSNHPVSQAIVRHADVAHLSLPMTGTHVVETSGQGIEIQRRDELLRLGRPAWLAGRGVAVGEVPLHNGPLVGVAIQQQFLGFLLLADELRPDAVELICDIRAQGIERVVLLTGDRAASAREIAGGLKVDEVIADALPEDKLAAVNRERAADRIVVVVGDGVNDALALAAGHVGIAMGARGADIAIQSADIALMTNDLGRISMAFRLARRARQVIAQNLAVALCTSGIMFGLGALGVLNPLSGALLHNVGTVLVLLNSSRMLKW